MILSGWATDRLVLEEFMGQTLDPKDWWSRRYEYPWVMQFVPEQMGWKVLDAGCGVDYPLYKWLALHCDVTAVDSDERIETLSHEGVTFLKRDLGDLGLPDETFDLTCCVSVLEHMSREAALEALAELARVTKPGSFVLVTVDVPRVDPFEVAKMAEELGLLMLPGPQIQPVQPEVLEWMKQEEGLSCYCFAFLKPFPEVSVKEPLIVDVGSGNHPFPLANVLVDLYPDDNAHRERGKEMVRDGRPVIVADVCNLPFGPKEVDFLWCSNVLEHCDDPMKALDEIERVAKRYFLMVPTMTRDAMMTARDPEGWKTHKWRFHVSDKKLYISEKKEGAEENVFVGPCENVCLEQFDDDSKDGEETP